MKTTIFPAGVAIVFGALVIPALAQQSEMPPGNDRMTSASPSAGTQTDIDQKTSAGQNGEQRGDLPAHVTAPGQSPAGTDVPDGATNREAPGAVGAPTLPNSRATQAQRNLNNNAQDPMDAEKTGNGQAPTGADASQTARPTQTPQR